MVSRELTRIINIHRSRTRGREGLGGRKVSEFGCDHARNLAERTGRDGDPVTRSGQYDHSGDPLTRRTYVNVKSWYRDRSPGTLVLASSSRRETRRVSACPQRLAPRLALWTVKPSFIPYFYSNIITKIQANFISYTKLEKYSARMTGKFGRKGPIRELSRGGFSVEKLFFRRRSVTNHHFEIETGEIVRDVPWIRTFKGCWLASNGGCRVDKRRNRVSLELVD